MANQYETVFIATPVLSDQQMKETVDKFKGMIEQSGGKIIHEESWGLKKLAYNIQHKSTGFYHMLEFAMDGAAIKKLETEYLRDERILRFLTMKMDKYAIKYSEKKRRMKSAESETKSENQEA
jgi:small subunit ribosomal protein S6